MLISVREFLFPFNNKIKVTAIVTARLQAVFKPSSRPSSSRLQDRLQAVFKTLRLRESAADLAPTSELRISRGVCCCRYSFCCLNSHHLLAAACGDPEIAFANSFLGSLKKCTNSRPFKSAKVKTFSNFHAVPSQAAHSEWIMMGPAHSWCQCGQLSLCSNSLVVQPRWGAGGGGGSGWAQ